MNTRNNTTTEIEVDIQWEFTPHDPGRYFGPPESCYPAEGGEVVKCIVSLPGGTIIKDGATFLRAALGGDRFDDMAGAALHESWAPEREYERD